MKNKQVTLALLLLGSIFVSAQEETTKKDTLKTGNTIKQEETRNVMLNATSNSGPREVNIGLPSSVGGMTVLENDLPTVYYFWPELPTRTWRPSTSLNMKGLISVGESTVTIGDFGFAVNSYTKTGGEENKVEGNLKINHYGYHLADINTSGKLADKWYYSAGSLIAADPGEAKHKGISLIDNTKIYRLALTHRFTDGEFTLGYKYANSNMISVYAPFVYHIDGTVTPYNNIGIGTDSYMLESGRMQMRNSITGEDYMYRYNDNVSYSNTFDFFGYNNLSSGWKF